MLFGKQIPCCPYRPSLPDHALAFQQLAAVFAYPAAVPVLHDALTLAAVTLASVPGCPAVVFACPAAAVPVLQLKSVLQALMPAWPCDQTFGLLKQSHRQVFCCQMLIYHGEAHVIITHCAHAKQACSSRIAGWQRQLMHLYPSVGL